MTEENCYDQWAFAQKVGQLAIPSKFLLDFTIEMLLVSLKVCSVSMILIFCIIRWSIPFCNSSNFLKAILVLECRKNYALKRMSSRYK